MIGKVFKPFDDLVKLKRKENDLFVYECLLCHKVSALSFCNLLKKINQNILKKEYKATNGSSSNLRKHLGNVHGRLDLLFDSQKTKKKFFVTSELDSKLKK